MGFQANMSGVDMITPNPEREAFERFFRSRNSKGVEWRERMFDRRAADDTYVEESVQRHWWTWQNALLARAQASAEDARDAARYRWLRDGARKDSND